MPSQATGRSTRVSVPVRGPVVFGTAVLELWAVTKALIAATFPINRPLLVVGMLGRILTILITIEGGLVHHCRRMIALVRRRKRKSNVAVIRRVGDALHLGHSRLETLSASFFQSPC